MCCACPPSPPYSDPIAIVPTLQVRERRPFDIIHSCVPINDNALLSHHPPPLVYRTSKGHVRRPQGPRSAQENAHSLPPRLPAGRRSDLCRQGTRRCARSRAESDKGRDEGPEKTRRWFLGREEGRPARRAAGLGKQRARRKEEGKESGTEDGWAYIIGLYNIHLFHALGRRIHGIGKGPSLSASSCNPSNTAIYAAIFTFPFTPASAAAPPPSEALELFGAAVAVAVAVAVAAAAAAAFNL